MLQSKKVFFLAGTLGQGGAEKQLFYLVKALKSAGFHVSVACLIADEYWQVHLENIGVPVLHIDAKGKSGRLRQVFAVLRRQKPSLVFSMHFFTNLYAALPARLLGIRSVGSIRNNGYDEVQSVGKAAAALSYYCPSIILANSVHGANNIYKIFPGRVKPKVLNNGIDLDFYKLPTGAESPPNVPCLVLIARLIPRKRVHLFIKLLGLILLRRVTAKAIIVGYGPEELALRQQAEAELPSSSVIFAGQQSNVVPWLHQGYVFVSTSTHEGTSNVFLEAMACGTPVAALRFEGVEQLIEHGKTGLLFDSIEAMADGLVAFLSDWPQRQTLASNARRVVEQHYSAETIAERFISCTQL